MGSGEEAAGPLSGAPAARRPCTRSATRSSPRCHATATRAASGLARPAISVSTLGAAQLISEIPDPELRGGLLQLIDAVGDQGITRAPSQESREQILRNTALSDPRAAAGVGALINMTLFLHYGAPDPQTGQNPNWQTFGISGPDLGAAAGRQAPRSTSRRARTRPRGRRLHRRVGARAAPSVAAVLAARGLDVVVLEAAGYYNESDFAQLELKAYQEMFWRGGPTPTADGNVSLVAGTTLGGGTTINWTNCLRTRPWVREQWAEHGLEGVDGPEFDRHLDAVGTGYRERLLQRPERDAATTAEGAEALGWSFETIVRQHRSRGATSPAGRLSGLRGSVRQQAERRSDLARRTRRRTGRASSPSPGRRACSATTGRGDRGGGGLAATG